MNVVTVHMPDEFLSALNELIRQSRFPNRSEAIRIAVRTLLQEEFPGWPLPMAQSFARRERARVQLEISRGNMDLINAYITQNKKRANNGRMTTAAEVVNRAIEFFFKVAQQNGVIHHGL